MQTSWYERLLVGLGGLRCVPLQEKVTVQAERVNMRCKRIAGLTILEEDPSQTRPIQQRATHNRDSGVKAIAKRTRLKSLPGSTPVQKSWQAETEGLPRAAEILLVPSKENELHIPAMEHDPTTVRSRLLFPLQHAASDLLSAASECHWRSSSCP